MNLPVIILFVVAGGLLWIPPCLCDLLGSDEQLLASGGSNWTCTCLFPNNGNQSTFVSSCLGSCSCHQGGGATGSKWTCLCFAGDLPHVSGGIHNGTCFTSCDCIAGFSFEDHPSASSYPIKVFLIILLSCVVITTFAVLVTITFRMCRRIESNSQAPLFISDFEANRNKITSIISQKISSMSGTTVTVNSPFSRAPGCFDKALFRRTKAEIFHGPLSRFSYSELESATDSFSDSNLIGVGGNSRVFRGQLKNGTTVAVKRLKQTGGADADFLFYTEVDVLSRLHHRHVVPLLGYCSEFKGRQSERLLVFEYMPNGNLRDRLDGRRGESMNWETRVAIAFGAARGLEYLHEAAAPRILHRDVKSTNILLDASWKAKITDLGLAKRLTADESFSCSSSPARVEGTFGYLAPEYAMIGRPSLMSDVFSFGVVLLEIISGRHPIQKGSGKGEASLVMWATPRLQDSRRVIEELPDPRLNGNFHEEEMQIVAYLAKECLLLNPDARPTMREVVQILSTIAPDKSRRRNMPAVMQAYSPFSSSIQPLFHGQNESQAESPSTSEDMRGSILTGYSRFYPTYQEEIFHIRSSNRNLDASVSPENMESLFLLSSNSWNLQSIDEEAVDLTEPRFESFCMASSKYP